MLTHPENPTKCQATVELGAQRALFGFDRTRAWGQNDDITVVTVRRAEC